jgi:hypothetical protein
MLGRLVLVTIVFQICNKAALSTIATNVRFRCKNGEMLLLQIDLKRSIAVVS